MAQEPDEDFYADQLREQEHELKFLYELSDLIERTRTPLGVFISICC